MPTTSANEAWLRQHSEPPLEPERPICDAHHHLWDFRRDTVHPRYLLDEYLAELASGHRIVSTVFIECGAMWRAESVGDALGLRSVRYVGETEFVNGIAAMSASGQYGEARVAAGIVGTVELTEGARVAEALRSGRAHV